MGIDIDVLLTSAQSMADACRVADPRRNPGVALGAMLAAGADRIVVEIAFGESASPRSDARRDLPCVSLAYDGLGAEFFCWEIATATAGFLLGVNPFDEPNVQALGDFQALDRLGRRALHVHLPRRDPPILQRVAGLLLG